MYSSSLLAFVLAITGVVAEGLTPFRRFDNLLFDRSPLDDLSRRQSCSSLGYVDCGNSCMPSGSVCCGAAGDYCPSDDYCTGSGCCPTGKRCSGVGGTINVDLTYTSTSSDNYYSFDVGYTTPSYSYSDYTTRTTSPAAASTPSCGVSETPCQGSCMPSGRICCPTAPRYCLSYGGCYQDSGEDYNNCVATGNAPRIDGSAYAVAVGREGIMAIGAAVFGAAIL